MARLFWPVIVPSYILPYHKCDNVSCETNIYHSKRSPPSSPYTQHNPYWNSPDGLHISSTPPFCFFYSSPSPVDLPILNYYLLRFVSIGIPLEERIPSTYIFFLSLVKRSHTVATFPFRSTSMLSISSTFLSSFFHRFSEYVAYSSSLLQHLFSASTQLLSTRDTFVMRRLECCLSGDFTTAFFFLLAVGESNATTSSSSSLPS